MPQIRVYVLLCWSARNRVPDWLTETEARANRAI